MAADYVIKYYESGISLVEIKQLTLEEYAKEEIVEKIQKKEDGNMKQKSLVKAIMYLFVLCTIVMIGSTVSYAATKATELSKCTITVKDAVLKEGKAIPTVVVKYKNKTLKKGTDYKLDIKNNKKYGTGTCKIVGLKKYSGSVTKKFKVVPDVAKNLKIEIQKYEDGSQGTILKWTPIKDTTGYILYVSEKEDGKYYEMKRIKAEEWGEMQTYIGEYSKGSFIKLKSFVYKDGTYYLGSYSKPVEIKKRGVNKFAQMRDYKVTNKQIKAPTNLKLVYDSPKDCYGELLPKTLCLQFTNVSDIAVKDWYIELYNQNGEVTTSINAGMEVAAGETILYPITDSMMYQLVPGSAISKIRVMGMDGGTDGWTSSPWFDASDRTSDDTFGPAAVLECKIDINLKQKGNIVGTLGTAPWGGYCINIKPEKSIYNSLEISITTQNGGNGGSTGVTDESGLYMYSYYEEELKEQLKDCLTLLTVCGLDPSTIKVKNDNTASFTVDRYLMTVKNK